MTDAGRPAPGDRATSTRSWRSSRRSSTTGHAYRTDDGSIFFRIASWPAYGRLARLDPDQLRVGRAGRGRRVRQGRRPRLRDLEGAQAGRAVVGDGDRRGPAGLAHRVLGDEHDAPRPSVRHPHRRRRPDLPAPRGRDRPERGGDRPAVRPDLAPLRPPPDGRREDGQVGRATSPGSATCSSAGVSPRALRYALISAHYRASLSYTDESLAAADRRGRAARRALPRAGDLPRGPGRRPDAAGALDAARTALRGGARRRPERLRRRWRRCSTWSASSTDGSTPGRCRRPTPRGRRPLLRDLDTVLGDRARRRRPTLLEPELAGPARRRGRPPGRPATGRRPTACATSWRQPGIAVEDSRDGQRWRRAGAAIDG